MFLAKKISNIMHGIKSAILAKLKNCQNGTFEPGHEIQKKIFTRSILLKHYGNGDKKIFSQLVPGSAKSRIYAEKSKKGDFLKKDSRELKFFSCFRFL